ncbi:MAG TPA: hypothetical protein VGQ52_17935 [Gemmatimonadaceae bacterium]|nr:hypothetical protein [Gemmatimonadaceae bacterium]
MSGFSVLWAVLVVQASQPAPVVRISAAQIARAPRLTIAPEPVWRIGGQADGPYAFARIVGATFSRDGGIGVLESNPPQVRLYDSAGKHRSSFGRRGRGPGEFENLQRFTPHTGDSLVVSQAYRVSVFDRAGKHGRTISTATAQTQLALAYRMLWDGSMLAATRSMPTAQEQASKREGITRDSTHIVILAANGAEIVKDLGKRPSTELMMARQGAGWVHTVRAFSAGVLMEGGDSLVFILEADGAQLDVLSASTGRQLRKIVLNLTPREVTERDREEFARSRRDGAARGPNPAIAKQGTEAYLKLMTYPRYMPYFDALRWSYDRVVRLKRYVAPVDSRAQWLSLTTGGQLLSVIDIPAKARVLDFDRDRVLIVERDADDLEYLALYKLIPSKR